MQDINKYLEELLSIPRKDVLEAAGDRLVVLPNPKEEISQGGIILPENAQEQSLVGTVLSVGSYTTGGYPMDINVGDEICYSKFAGQKQEYQGKTLLVLGYTEVGFITKRAIVEDNPVEQ